MGRKDDTPRRVQMTDEEWQARLSPDAYRVTRKAGTERAFTGAYHDHKGDGVYRCVCCGVDLFDSAVKYDSGSGWPSFWEALPDAPLEEQEDRKLFMTRTEALCADCGAHLGHIFPDGPEPTGRRYCINSAALTFVPRGEADDADPR